jgi:hypothetical protein
MPRWISLITTILSADASGVQSAPITSIEEVEEVGVSDSVGTAVSEDDEDDGTVETITLETTAVLESPGAATHALRRNNITSDMNNEMILPVISLVLFAAIVLPSLNC